MNPQATTMQYTVRGITPEINDALRLIANTKKTSINQLMIDGARKIAGISTKKTNGLDRFAGAFYLDEKFDEAMKDMRKVDPRDWQ
jgi:hypothetical protein